MTDSDGAMVRRLLDIEEIKRLKAGYFRCLDRKEWDEFEHVFARDAVLEVPEANICETGRDAIVAAVSGVLTGTTTVHHGHMPEIEITGADTARGTWAMFDDVEWASDAGNSPDRAPGLRSLHRGVRARRRCVANQSFASRTAAHRPAGFGGSCR